MDVELIEENDRRAISVLVFSGPNNSFAHQLVSRLRSFDGSIVAYENEMSTNRLVIPLNAIGYIETDNRHCRIITADGRRFQSQLTLHELETRLEGTDFLRVSRQQIVNFRHVELVRPEPNGRLTLKIGTTYIGVSRTYARDVKELLGISESGR